MQGEDGESRHLPIRHKTCPDKTKHWLTHYTTGIKVVAAAEGTYQQDLRTVLQQKIEARLSHETAASSDQPVDIRTFITHPDYCGDTGFWEKPLQELEQILADECKGACIEKGIRGGKSYGMCYIPVYLTYRLIFEEVYLGVDPREKYDLRPDTAIYNAIFTINGKLARRLFNYIAGFIDNCKWFKRPEVEAKVRINPNIKSEIQFCKVKDGVPQWDKVRYAIYPGHSKLTSAAGVALYTYIFDECNLFEIAESSGKDYAEELDEECEMRVTSSFGSDGRRIYISRRNIVSDFTSRKIAKWKKLDSPKRYYTPKPKTSWEDWPDLRNQREQWRLFDTATLQWVLKGEEIVTRSWEEFDPSTGFWIPERFWDDFSTNPESAIKILGSIPGEAQDPYIRLRDRIKPSFDLVNPVLPHVKAVDWMKPQAHFDDLVADWFQGNPAKKYHFHVDPSIKRDATGIVISHSSGVIEKAQDGPARKPEKIACVDIDAIIQIRAPEGGEIELKKIREILYWLRSERGFRFGTSSYDSYQSKESIQQLRRKGFPVEELSVDRTLDPYETFKQHLYEGCVFFPPAHGQTREQVSYADICQFAEDGDPSAIFQKELYELELVKGKKVDHPSHGSKDLADAACGSVYQSIRFAKMARSYQEELAA